jgi:DNA-binding PucR family transcriptional regulator
VLNIHPNTVRYRVRRAADVSGVDFEDPAQRILTQLQLRL